MTSVVDLNDGSNADCAFNLSKIWDDSHLLCYVDDKNKKRWKCLWCNENYAGWHATKALIHLAKEPKMDIAPCKAYLPDDDALIYRTMFDRYLQKRGASVSSKLEIALSLDSTNEANANALLEQQLAKKKRKASSPGIPQDVSTITQTTTPTAKEYIQLTLTGESGPNAENKLSMAIADFIHGCGLPFSVADHPKFRKVITLAKAVGTSYQIPTRRRIATDLLEINYKTYQENNKEQLVKDVNVFGLSFYGDGATVKKMPLTNILASGAYLQTALLEIVDATAHLEKGGKKDATYIASLIRPHIDEYEKDYPYSVDYCAFDGAANVQKAGRILQAHYPRIVLTHGAEHVMSLFFQDVFKLPILCALSKIVKKTYILFGSGAMHAPYALFQKHSRANNEGKNIGMFRSAGTRMGGEVIALMRLLRLKEAFLQTLQSPEFIKLKVSCCWHIVFFN
jgi:hypothetical protein